MKTDHCPDGVYITTPIYYVNDTPHIGHAYTTIAADVWARYHRLLGAPVFFLTGTDEYGQKVAEAAAKRGVTPQHHTDTMVTSFQNLWKELNITHDDFVRTTQKRHHQGVQHALTTLWNAGEIYEGTYEGWYCLPDERFWTEKDLIDGKCPECRRVVTPLSEKNYFFKMAQYQDRLRRYILEHPEYILPARSKNEIMGFLEKPLGDLCISRPKRRLAWGIPLPFDANYVTYVWVDALVNYISMRGYGTDHFSGWPATLHIVGKDILTTHAVYWSTLLMALDLPLPRQLFAHGWWTVDGEKMSKSRGNVVDPSAVVKAVGVDPFRYFLLREVPFGEDGNFSMDALWNRYESDLANDLGNLVSRTLTLIARFSEGGRIPHVAGDHPATALLREKAEQLADPFSEAMQGLAFHRAIAAVWTLVDQANRYIEQMAPWALAKDPSRGDALAAVLYATAESVRITALYLAPFMPETAEKINRALGLSKEYGAASFQQRCRWGWDFGHVAVIKPEPLFPRGEDETRDSKLKTKNEEPRGEKPPKTEADALIPPSLSIEEFRKLDLRVGVICDAEPVPKSKKLLRLQVEVGLERRQVVAGIAERYAPEALLGKRIVLVCNLAPATIRGVLSEGMLLAAGDESVLGLVTFTEEIPSGTKVR